MRPLHLGAKLSKADVQTVSMLGKSAGSSEATLGGPGD
jgi:cytochrome c